MAEDLFSNVLRLIRASLSLYCFVIVVSFIKNINGPTVRATAASELPPTRKSFSAYGYKHMFFRYSFILLPKRVDPIDHCSLTEQLNLPVAELAWNTSDEKRMSDGQGNHGNKEQRAHPSSCRVENHRVKKNDFTHSGCFLTQRTS